MGDVAWGSGGPRNLLHVPALIAIARRDRILAEHASVASTMLTRTRGLLGRDGLRPGEGLIIERARQVHTFGMRFSIDVVFCDREWRVRHVVRNMKPGRMTRWVRGARYVIELPNGAVPDDLAAGDQLSVRRL